VDGKGRKKEGKDKKRIESTRHNMRNTPNIDADIFLDAVSRSDKKKGTGSILNPEPGKNRG
jgi:hypothetical protein